jgi:hypothetical protein
MHLGFYSQLARRHVVKAREFAAARGNSNPMIFVTYAGIWLWETQALNCGLSSLFPNPCSTSSASSWMLVCCMSIARASPAIRPRPICQPGRASRPTIPITFAGMYQFWIQRPIDHSRPGDQPVQRNGTRRHLTYDPFKRKLRLGDPSWRLPAEHPIREPWLLRRGARCACRPSWYLSAFRPSGPGAFAPRLSDGLAQDETHRPQGY